MRATGASDIEIRTGSCFFFFKQKTAYEIETWLEFRRVLFRSLEQIPEAERLNPEAVVNEINRSERSAFYEANANAIIERIVPMLKKNDIVTVFSNGGFDGKIGRASCRERVEIEVGDV